MTKELLEYFNNDELSASVWRGKYALKNSKGEIVEQTPQQMHLRMANELAWAETFQRDRYLSPQSVQHLTLHGDSLYNHPLSSQDIMRYFENFKYIIPQGSIMSALGNKYKLQSLSNCFVIPPPFDSYGGIFKTDQETAQLEKRRGGVGTNINTLRPDDTPVLNAAGTSTGSHSFMDRFSNTTREVAQNGRRGALMLLMSVVHPDIFRFVNKKKDRTKVTGANISVQLTNLFMQAVENGEDFLCKFPIDLQVEMDDLDHVELPYNKLVTLDAGLYVMRIKASELFDEIVNMAWDNAEPGIAFMDRVINYSPDGVYEQFKAIASNPCGEQWMQAYDACRLLATNLFSFVVNPYRKDSYLDYEKMYEVFYIQQRLADDIVTLEIKYINDIIDKIENDPEPKEIKQTELDLWIKVRDTAKNSRRTGCGFTALADMLAALNLKYDSDEALEVIKKVMRTKMQAELDCTTDLAITRGSFVGFKSENEFTVTKTEEGKFVITGNNEFYQMLVDEFEESAWRIIKWGRRNVSWSTVAPTGSVSIIAILNKYSNVSGGLEPHFLPYFFRNKKVNPSDKDAKVDFVDQNGDSWQTYPVLMGGFKEWYSVRYETEDVDEALRHATKQDMEDLFKASPFYGSCANDISWEKRIEIQSIIQRYTTNAISSTLNLPKDVSKSTVAKIYYAAHRAGLKGVTIYRDGCRTGVLVSDNSAKTEGIVYHDAPKRPEKLSAELSIVTVKGVRYAVLVGLLKGKPYEVFAFIDNGYSKGNGVIVKRKKGVYSYIPSDSEQSTIENIGEIALHADEQMLTRLVSGMMRHGVNPKFIYQQIDKCPLEVVGFGSALKRIVKKYVPEKELVEGQKCNDCSSTNLKLQEGCVTCADCGSSKCG